MNVVTTETEPTVEVPVGAAGLHGSWWRRRRWIMLAVVVLVLVGAGAGIAIANPFGPSGPTGVKDNAAPTGFATVTRQNLTSQKELSATLGYAGSYTVDAPSGTTSKAVMQAEQAVTGDESMLTADATTVSGAQGTLANAQSALSGAEATEATQNATLSADQKKEANDCQGAGSTTQACATDEQQTTAQAQKVAQNEQNVSKDQQTVTHDKSALTQARAAETTAQERLTDAKATLSTVEKEAAIPTDPISKLPSVGQVIGQGQTLYSLGITPVVLLYGATPATRNLFQGESGPDVAELNADLRELNYMSAPTGDVFTSGTASAVSSFQTTIGVPATGNLPLGQVVFLPTAARVTSLAATLGGTVQPGAAVLDATSTTRQVTIALDAADQSEVADGDKVSIVLPNGTTTPGVISSVGTVATTPSSSGHTTSSSSTPTITVLVTPTDPKATGSWDQAPVDVTITTGSVNGALVVPVDALLALASGGYAVEVVGTNGAHSLVPVTLGLFDDAAGLVQVTDTTLTTGERVVVPKL